jgi:SNF2 family DNA or RNA helicase
MMCIDSGRPLTTPYGQLRFKRDGRTSGLENGLKLFDAIPAVGWYETRESLEATKKAVARKRKEIPKANKEKLVGKESSTKDVDKGMVDEDLELAWNLMKSQHALRDKSIRSSSFMDENDPKIKAALAPILAAAGPSFSFKPHQKDGIGMMLHFEQSSLRGCLQADDMGLGKTLQILALFLLNPMPEAMLVVMPAAIIPNWIAEIEKFLNLPKGDVVAYQRGKGISRSAFRKAKIVLTSYHQVAREQKDYEEVLAAFRARRYDPNAPVVIRPEIPLIATSWGRLVLDEGH